MEPNQAKGMPRNLDIGRLESQINDSGWVKPLVFSQVTSTNDLVVQNFELAIPGSGVVVVANEQTHGRGRLDRSWSTPPGSGVAMSIGLAVDDFAAELSAIPLVVGVAIQSALSGFKVNSTLKWPNDIVFIDEAVSTEPKMRKLGGVLVQLINNKLIIGIGINVDLAKSELPVEHATSLRIEGYEVDRIELIGKVLEEINKFRTYNNQWLSEYKKICSTIGKNIQVEKISGEKLIGEAVDVTSSGALVVKNLENLYQVTVGDVVHLGVTQY